MKEIRVTVKVRNNLLLKAIEETGDMCGQKFAIKVGISYTFLNDLANMTRSARDAEGNLRPEVQRLCEYLNKAPFDLFTDSQMDTALETNTATAEVEQEEVHNLLAASPLQALEDKECVESLHEAVARLPERQAEVLRLRFGLDCNPHTLDEAGVKLDVSRERIRQIEIRALRKLRINRTKWGLTS